MPAFGQVDPAMVETTRQAIAETADASSRTVAPGLAHELLDRARHPKVADRIPVLYITVPPAATAPACSLPFARSLNLPVRA